MSLENEIAFVSGASRGIGKEIALTLGAQGATVIGTATSENGAENISNKNDLNALKSMGIFSKGVSINKRFTDTDAWFIRTSCPDTMKCFNRVNLAMSMEGDFDTDNGKCKARERYSYGWSDWRGTFGSAGV